MNTQTEKGNGKNKKATPPPTVTAGPKEAVSTTTGDERAGVESASTEVATRSESGLPAMAGTVADQEVLNSDIIIPQVLLMQGLSDFVADGKAMVGDLVRSTTAEKLGDAKKAITFIPLRMTNAWVIQEKVNGKFEFRGIEPRNAKNEDQPWDFVKNGTDWKRVKAINVFALLPQDVVSFRDELKKAEESGEILDLEKTLMPVMISFRSTSFNAGKTVATFFTKVKSNLQYNKNVAPYKYELSLECEQTENDKGKFMVFKVGTSKPVKDTQVLEEAQKWYQILNTKTDVKVDMSGDGGEGAATTPLDVTEVSAF